MRIACVANINNMMFILCRYLRDEGFDAELITLADEPAHFSPSADSYKDDYLSYYTVLPFTKSTVYSPEAILEIGRKLGAYDFYIGSDIAPALLALIGKKLDVFVPHGSDIYALPFEIERPLKTNKVWWLREKTTLRKFQEIGIRYTTTILFPDEYDIHFPFKNKLKTEAVYHNTSGPMVYIPQYENITKNEEVQHLPNFERFAQLRAENDLLIFSHSRHNGFHLQPSLAMHQKGNDVLIRGFANFVKKASHLRCKLILFDYGMDVEASKRLIEILEIEEFIVWMPMMQRKEIMLGLNMADISCGQFDNSWLTCGVVNETLASNIPLLHFREDTLYTRDYATLYPIMNAKTDKEIEERISQYMTEPLSFKQDAQNGAAWLHQYTVQNPIRIIKKMIESKAVDTTNLSEEVLKECQQILTNHRNHDKRLRIIAKLKNYFVKA